MCSRREAKGAGGAGGKLPITRQEGKRKREIEKEVRSCYDSCTLPNITPRTMRVPFLSSACARSLPSSCQVLLVSPTRFDEAPPLYPVWTRDVYEDVDENPYLKRENSDLVAISQQIARARFTCGPRDRKTDARGAKYKRMRSAND